MSITLPPLPEPAFSLRWERGEYKVSPPMDDCDCYTADQLRARDIEVARLVLEAAAKVLTEHQIPVGNSAAGELACEWTLDALKECHAAIRALEFHHE